MQFENCPIHQKADFAIASNGRTIFEIGALNVPLIGVSVKAIEQNHTFIEDNKVGFHVNFYNSNVRKQARSQEPERI